MRKFTANFDPACRNLGASSGLCSVLLLMTLALVSGAKGQFVGSEDFSGQLRQDKWFPFTQGSGDISLTGQEFNFTSTVIFGEHEAGLAWVNTPVSFSEDWEFQLDVANSLNVSSSSRYAAVGIYVANEDDENDLAYLEFYSAYFDDLGSSVRGFTSGLKRNGVELHEGDTFELPVEIGALRAKYDASENSLALYFHTGSTEVGYFWQLLAKYGLNGSGGTDANAVWGMSADGTFDVGLYGSVQGTRSRVGQLTADNFSADRPAVGVHEVDFELTAQAHAAEDTGELSWFSFDGLEYVVEKSADLKTWTFFKTLPGTGTYSELEVPANSNDAPLFYRVYSRVP